MENWYYSVGGSEIGPLSKEEIIRLINSGEITDDTLLKTEEFTKWEKLSDIKYIFFFSATSEESSRNIYFILALNLMILGILGVIFYFSPFSFFAVCLIIILIIRSIKRGVFASKIFAATIVVLFLISVFFFILLFKNIKDEKGMVISCNSNLRQISFSLEQYALDNAGYFPPYDGAAGLEILRKNNYLNDYKIYTCPSTDTKIPLLGQPLREENVSYHYKGGYTEKDSSDSAILWDKDGNHTKYGNILFLDGHVVGYSGADWKKNIKSK